MPRSIPHLIDTARLMTPSEHLSVLFEPAPERVCAALDTWRTGDCERAVVLDGVLGAVRTALRVELKLDGPVILTGHQAELVHAGVLAKTIAADALARRLGGLAAFLLVDSDLPKVDRLVVPQATAGGLRRVEVVIPGCDRRRPQAWQPRVSRADWLQFFASIASLYEFRAGSLIDDYARAWLTTGDANPAYCDALTRANSAAATALGLSVQLVLRVSGLARTSAFRVFVAQMLLDARRCAQCYNTALEAYRKRHRVRASGRPVPALLVTDSVVELPLWVMRLDEPRRRLFVSECGSEIELATDQRVLGRLDRDALGRLETHGQPWPLEAAGWRLWPRALTLSAFARLFLADVFIHGIGGARYDEMMEDFVYAWLGGGVAPACCVSATLCLPFELRNVCSADVAAAWQRCRDLRCNPQRHLDDPPGELVRRRAELVRRSDELRRLQPDDHIGRGVVFRELRRVNEQLLASDPWRNAKYEQEALALEADLKSDRIALDREYFHALHSRSTLEELVRRIRRVVDCRTSGG